MDWTEIIVTVNTSAVEMVANLIHETGAGGVVIEHNKNQTSTVTAYFPVGEEAQAMLAQLDQFWADLEGLDIQADARVDTRTVLEQDWAEEWKKHYHPVQVGNVYITPSWIKHTPSPDQISVVLDPGMAFGTGIHPTTQMCIGEITSTLVPGQTMMDLGTGSGILSIVAAKLGASRVDSVDNDRVAVEVAQDNARRNQCEITQTMGDAFELFRDSKHDVVVANIGFNACAKLADIYTEESKSCVLILSGFPEERMSELQEYDGGRFLRSKVKEGWGCLVLGPK
jgi:ribosomal protein L11 methyltransferase